MDQIWTPPPEFMDEIVRSTNGIHGVHLHYLRKDKAVGRLFEMGFFWEGWVRDILIDLYEPGTDILDIGAHIGTQALCFLDILQNRGGDGRVICFEPVYSEILKKNVDARRTVIFPYGIGAADGILTTHIHPWNSSEDVNFGATALDPSRCPVALAPLYHGSYGPIQIPIITLATWSRLFEHKKIGIVKIDVEGLELDVLRGGLDLIREHQPVIVIEIWQNNLMDFFASDVAQTILATHNVYKPNPDVFDVCKICVDDYILVPKTRSVNHMFVPFGIRADQE